MSARWTVTSSSVGSWMSSGVCEGCKFTIVLSKSLFGEYFMDIRMQSDRYLIALSRWSGQFLRISLAAIFLQLSLPGPYTHSHLIAFNKIFIEPSKRPFIHGEYAIITCSSVPMEEQ